MPRTTDSMSRTDTNAVGGLVDGIAAKQCYHCQGLGHVQADCPTLRLSGGTSGHCYSCGRPGHLAVSLASLSSGSNDHTDRGSATALHLASPVWVAAVLLWDVVASQRVEVSLPTTVQPCATSVVDPTTSPETVKLRHRSATRAESSVTSPVTALHPTAVH